MFEAVRGVLFILGDTTDPQGYSREVSLFWTGCINYSPLIINDALRFCTTRLHVLLHSVLPYHTLD